MSEQNGGLQTEQNGTTALQEYQEWEVDNFVAEAEAKGIIKAFVYSFKQGGRTITGLTARAIEEICLLTKPRVSIIKSKVEEIGDRVWATATAQIVYFTPATKETRPDGTIIETQAYEEKVNADGVRSEPIFFANGERNPHVEQTALTKAERAARRQLISQAALIQAKEYLLKKQGGKPVNVPQGVVPPKNRQQQAKSNANDTRTQAEAMAFAKYSDRAAELEKLGISKAIFWEGVKAFFKVKSREQMTAAQYSQLCDALSEKDFAEWIRNLAPKTESESVQHQSCVDAIISRRERQPPALHTRR